MAYTIHTGSNLDILPTLPDNSVDAIVTDPPYELGFMGKSWDSTGIAYNVGMWRECLRVLKPGGHVLAFSGSRTYHRMACAIEDAGFQIRDQMMWVYGSGFPKSHNISKALDKDAGVEPTILGRNPNSRENSKQDDNLYEAGTVGKTAHITKPTSEQAVKWEGWGTALKPAHEPIVLARKPLEGTVADNVLKWGTGGLNIDGCRLATKDNLGVGTYDGSFSATRNADGSLCKAIGSGDKGRFPANFMHDGSPEVVDLFPNNAARFFYCPKASKSDRDDGCDKLELKRTAKLAGANNDRENLDGLSERFRTTPSKNNHPTVKPNALMQYLCRLITPPGGTVLDPFMGSGSTGRGAVSQGFNFIGIELSHEYVEIAKARIEAVNTL